MTEGGKPINRAGLIQAQRDLCVLQRCPMFAPDSGVCWKCGKDIVTPQWGRLVITGCPKCNWSFCE